MSRCKVKRGAGGGGGGGGTPDTFCFAALSCTNSIEAIGSADLQPQEQAPMDSKWYFFKLKSCKLAPSIQKQLSNLTALLWPCPPKFKVHFKGQVHAVQSA